MAQPIGERQRWAWLAAGLSAAAAAKACGYHWLWVLAGGLAVTVWYLAADRMLGSGGLAQQLSETFGWGGRVIAAVTILWTVPVLGWTANLADTAFPMVNGFPGLGWIMLALAAWAGEKGPGACARCCGVLCLFLIVLYGVIAAFAAPDITLSYLTPTADWDHGLWTAGIFLLPAGVWYVPCCRSQKGIAWQMAILLPVLAAVLAAVTAGVLSPELAAARPVPIYDLAQSVSLFGVVERIEPLLSAAVLMGVFALLSSMVCAVQALADQVKPWRWSGAAACAAAGAAMGLTKDLPVELIAIGAGVFWLAIPVLTVLIGRKRERRT